MTPNEFVKWIYPQAKTGEISPVFVTAQAALETGWGSSAIGNNLFGITKGSSWSGPVQLVTTTEFFPTATKTFKLPEKVLFVKKEGNRYRYRVQRLFRDYPSIAECLEDHLSILKKPGYSDAWPFRKDPEEFVRRIVDSDGAKYATDPNYAANMIRLFFMVNKIVKDNLL